MTYPILCSVALLPLVLLSAPASAENHTASSGFGAVVYGNDDCNNDPDYLAENDILCTAVFSETNVWDFLNGLQRRITFDRLVELNPELLIEDFDTVLGGITFVRVR